MRTLTPALLPALLVLALAACGEKDETIDSADDSGAASVDADGDGYNLNEDCDDNDAAVYPGAAEVCDGADNDCDGLTDDADDAVSGQQTWYSDADRDGYGVGEGALSCQQPPDTSANAEDCDDASIAVNPGAEESCDGVDNDCDGFIDDADDDVTGTTEYFTDGDGDGYGGQIEESCEVPSDAARMGGDCDDADAAISPGAAELCDGIDNDCDGATDDDDDDLSGADTWYADSDGDGHGDASSYGPACAQPSGTSADGDDCDDGDSAVSPSAEEACDDEVDNDCDGDVDEACDASPFSSIAGIREYAEGYGTYGFRDCETSFDMSGVAISASACPECDFAFDVTNTYDPANSTIYTACSFARTADFTQVLGFDLDYYGAGYPVMWIGYYGAYYAYYNNNLSLDVSAGTASWTYGYLDYPIGRGYYFTYYEYGYAALYP